MAKDELDVLIRTLWGEGRGEGFDGMVAIAWVIRNRAAAPGWWGKTIETVCLKPWQFSCWNSNDPNSPYLRGAKDIPEKEYEIARRSALHALASQDDPTDGATHYYSTSMKRPPTWAKGAKFTTKIGRHMFYRDVP